MTIALRVPTAALAGGLITSLILCLMQFLIATGEVALTETTRHGLLEFVRVKRAELPPPPTSRFDKPRPPDAVPPSLPPRTDPLDGNRGYAFRPDRPQVEDTSPQAGTHWAVSDGDYLPIVKVAPDYPHRAITLGLSGYVIVEYTVTRLGTVTDAHVIDADPPGVFDDAAVRSALQYKYRPRVVNGTAIDVPGVRTIVRFELAED